MVTEADLYLAVALIVFLVAFTCWNHCTKPEPKGRAPEQYVRVKCVTGGCSNWGNGKLTDGGRCNACAKRV